MCLFVRDLTSAESAKLSRLLRNPRNGIQMRRAQIISFSGQGMRVQEIGSSAMSKVKHELPQLL
jgi:hypothetical protein